MPIRKMPAALLALGWLLACWPPAQAADGTFPARLGREERLLLEQTVCAAAGVAEIDARTFVAGGKPNYADVRCRPHAQLAGQPLYHVAQCAAEGGRWSCGRAALETRVALKERELIVRPGTVEPGLAVETIRKISRYGYFQAKSLDAALQSTCSMGMGDAPDLIEISCRRWSITVSFWCPQKNTAPACPRVIYLSEH